MKKVKYDQRIAGEYLNKLLDKYKIQVIAWSATSCGKAWYKTRKIKIPAPTNLDRFGVCLHEVKHIINGNKGSRYEQEFACDMYALNIFKEFGYPTEKWENRMRWHSLSRIAMAFNRGLHLNKLSPEIKEFFKEVDFKSWKGKSVFVGSDGRNKPYKITLTLKLSKDEIEKLLNRKGLMLSKSYIDDSTYGHWIVQGNDSVKTPNFETLSEIVEFYKLEL